MKTQSGKSDKGNKALEHSESRRFETSDGIKDFGLSPSCSTGGGFCGADGSALDSQQIANNGIHICADDH